MTTRRPDGGVAGRCRRELLELAEVAAGETLRGTGNERRVHHGRRRRTWAPVKGKGGGDLLLTVLRRDGDGVGVQGRRGAELLLFDAERDSQGTQRRPGRRGGRGRQEKGGSRGAAMLMASRAKPGDVRSFGRRRAPTAAGRGRGPRGRGQGLGAEQLRGGALSSAGSGHGEGRR